MPREIVVLYDLASGVMESDGIPMPVYYETDFQGVSIPRALPNSFSLLD